MIATYYGCYSSADWNNAKVLMLLFPFVNDVLYYEKVETYKLSIRSWLEKNKIFIETSSTIVLIAIAVMASG